MTHLPDHIKAVASTAELLAALESFEVASCHFGGVTTAYIRAIRTDPNRETFTYGGATFEAATYSRAVLILAHVAKPDPMNLDVRTLRPFAQLLVEHGFRQARLVSPSAFNAWVEVTKDGASWRRLCPETPAASEPTETPEEEAHVAESA